MDKEDFVLSDLETGSDQEFRQWTADMAKKYPKLLNSYGLLRECWDYYNTK